jgi:hypothetical protein
MSPNFGIITGRPGAITWSREAGEAETRKNQFKLGAREHRNYHNSHKDGRTTAQRPTELTPYSNAGPGDNQF